ncbi:post-transcriptional regulator [Vagococcus sp. PNs007]|uniref:Post-transcriptional regulator n=1 Tax=Vagococcus proximus TaxID=2991417 RepID=A0ABT5X158_9ENTE|nr:post-transcriptional regulator [Vagococcus proximus]MDF0479724.1 post-transcriptional regulator [Vagococcus proximus]
MTVPNYTGYKGLLLNTAVKKKYNEFTKHGYKEIKLEEFWDYLENYRWQKKDAKNVWEKRRDILSVTENEFFDYQVIRASTIRPQDFDWNKIDDLL